LKLIRKFIFDEEQTLDSSPFIPSTKTSTQLCKRVIACLDVRGNEHGDLVVTKGDQYDVKHEGNVRNLGKPVELAKRYFDEGADEVTFLNITSFKNCPLTDLPMLEVLKLTSAQVFFFSFLSFFTFFLSFSLIIYLYLFSSSLLIDLFRFLFH